jgi:hypothetical protein
MLTEQVDKLYVRNQDVLFCYDIKAKWRNKAIPY